MSSPQNTSESVIKIFGKWDTANIEQKDAGLKGYISVAPTLVPHSCGRHETKSQREVSLNGSGKTEEERCRIVERAEIVARSGSRAVPSAIENYAQEEVTRISYGGISYPQAVDASPQRRVDLALRFITDAARNSSFSSNKPIEECLADEIALAGANDNKAYSVQKREEIERIAISAR